MKYSGTCCARTWRADLHTELLLVSWNLSCISGFLSPHIFFYFFFRWILENQKKEGSKMLRCSKILSVPTQNISSPAPNKIQRTPFLFWLFYKKEFMLCKNGKDISKWKIGAFNLGEEMGSTPPPQECSILSWNRVNKLGFFPHNNAFSQGGNSLNEKCSFINILVASYLEIKCSLLPLHCRRRWSHFAHLESIRICLFCPF